MGLAARHRTTIGSACLAVAASLVGGETFADSHCISSRVYCDREIVTNVPSYSTFCGAPHGTGYAWYDIPAGQLHGSGWSAGGSVTMRDSFQVVGPATGTPLNFTAQLTVTGYVDRRACGIPCCYAWASASIVEGSSSPAQATFNSLCGVQSFNTTIGVQVHRLSGERFQIDATVGAGGIEGSSGEITGTLRFSGLPQGASVISCNGFLQGPPVPVVPTSWGRVKTLYR